MSLEHSPARQKRRSSAFPRVIPWLEWVKLRGISLSTAERLEKAGKVKVTRMSPRRKGVREDHDQEYLDSCVRGGA
jgi:predicted site-specific integrase-resolvase